MKLLFTLTLLCAITSITHAQQRLWVAIYPDSAVQAFTNDMVVDTGGNSYVTGYFMVNNDYSLKRFFIVKNNTDGVQQWVREYPQPDSFSVGNALAVDNLGNVYVTGERYDTSCNICTITVPHSYSFVIKYNDAGNIVWHNRYDGVPQTNQTPAAIALATTGAVFITGEERKYNSATFTQDQFLFTQKITGTGKTSWVKILAEATGKAITVDKSNRPIVTGARIPGNIYQLSNILTIKYKPSGDVLWMQDFKEYQKNGTGYFIKTDGRGNVYVHGQTDTLTFYNIPRVITIKYNANGAQLWWQKEQPRTNTMPHIYGGFAVDFAGNSYTAYSESSNYPNDNWLVVKRTAGGALRWSRQYDDSIHASDKPSGGIVVDNAGNVTVAGYSTFARNTPFTTIQYDANGTEKWTAFYKRGNNSNNYPSGIGIDADGDIYVGGGAPGGVAVVKYNSSLNALPVANKMMIAPVVSVDAKVQMQVYPNPATTAITVTTNNLPAARYQCSVYSIDGKLVKKSMVNISAKSQTFTQSLAGLNVGNYVLELSNNQQKFECRFMKQ